MLLVPLVALLLEPEGVVDDVGDVDDGPTVVPGDPVESAALPVPVVDEVEVDPVVGAEDVVSVSNKSASMSLSESSASSRLMSPFATADAMRSSVSA